MSVGAAQPQTLRERELLEAARSGDEGAFRRLVEPHRSELLAHCYRMLGSVHDAEDALQDALLRAWRGLPRFEARSSLRSWLYRIATNTCLDADRQAAEAGAADRLRAAAGIPTTGRWHRWSSRSGSSPSRTRRSASRTATRPPRPATSSVRAVELAFIAALQHLPANQRAALILREVLGFSAREVAEILDTTTASVNSALQRARKAVDERLPEQSQQATLRSLGDEGMREVVEGYVDAWDRGDIDAVVAMLTEDACFSMPPAPSWHRRQRGAGRLPRGRAAVGGLALAPPARPGQRPAGARLLQLGRGGGGVSSVRAQRADHSRSADQRRDRVHRPVDRVLRSRGATSAGRRSRSFPSGSWTSSGASVSRTSFRRRPGGSTATPGRRFRPSR